MEWILLGALGIPLVAARPWLRRRRARRVAAAEALRTARKIAEEDVTVLGEQLAELHVDLLATELDETMRAEYQQALDTYERAKIALRDASTVEGVASVHTLLDDGRFARACLLARRDGEEPPTRRDPCFFNPQHGPAATDVAWTPPGGVPRPIPVCRADANRLANGELPAIRMVRTGAGLMPWFAAGELASPGNRRRQALHDAPGHGDLEAGLAQFRNHDLRGPGGI